MDLLFGVVRDAGFLTFVACWIGSALVVYRDARRRFDGAWSPPLLLLTSLAAPLAGPMLYVALRPETLLDRRERRAVRRSLEQALAPEERCLVCLTPTRPDFLCCPGCGVELTTPCSGCAKPLKLHWNACPYCEAASTTAASLEDEAAALAVALRSSDDWPADDYVMGQLLRVADARVAQAQPLS